MSLRGILVALIVAATAAFVVGVALERGRASGHHDTTPSAAVEGGEAHTRSGEASQAHSETGGAAETGGVAERGSAEPRGELRPLGVDVEAWPFVAIAAAASLALAAAAGANPRAVALLALVGAAMLAFAALDVREVVHQFDENDGGLALLAGTVAALHLAVAAVAAAMAGTMTA
jgi:hypothetical protein